MSHNLAALSLYKSSSAVHVKHVTGVARQIISLLSCVGSMVHIMTRFLFSVVNSAVSWDGEVFLSDDSLCEIEFLSNNGLALNDKIYWGASSLPVRVSCFSDASNSDCSAFVESQPELTFNQNWSLAVSFSSSLACIFYSLLFFVLLTFSLYIFNHFSDIFRSGFWRQLQNLPSEGFILTVYSRRFSSKAISTPMVVPSCFSQVERFQ